MKKVIGFSVASLIVLAVVFNIRAQAQAQSLDEIIHLLNIELLTELEDNGNWCFHNGTIDCPTEEVKVKYVW